MSEPAEVNFNLYRGVKRTLRFTMTENGSVAGFSTWFTARTKASAADPVAFGKAGTISDAGSSTTPGVFLVPISKAESLTLDAGIYAFSFERSDVGNEDLYTKGKMTVKYDVRNAA